MKRSRLGIGMLTIGLLCAALGSPTASAQPSAESRSRVTRLDILKRDTVFGGMSFDTVGRYELLIAKATAVIDPRAVHNAGIVDLDRAPRNAQGLVQYTFDVQILKPVDITKGNRALFYEVNNRGGRIVYTYFNERDIGYEASDAGSGFLMKHGYTAVWSGWLPGDSRAPSAPKPPPLFAQLPIATDNGKTIVGTAREEWIANRVGAFSGRLSYPAATLDQTRAQLTRRQNEADRRQPLASSHWRYADDRTVHITPPPGANAGTIYEFIYSARDPIVTGLGFAAVRELISFLRHRVTDDAGQPNPLFVDGKPVLRVAVATGTSLSGGMQRDFIYQGFNRDTMGQKVFDGMNPIVAGGRKRFINYRFAQPGRTNRQHEDHLFPGSQFPFTYHTSTDPLSGKSDGLFARCSQSNTCPHVIQVDSDTESYSGHASLVLTDTQGRAIDLPTNVRYYYLTTAHLQGRPGAMQPPAPAGCRDDQHAVSPFPYYRAAYDALVQWERDGTPPPPTKAPSVGDGTFITVAEQSRRYPMIPNKPYNFTISEVGVRNLNVFPPTESANKYPQFVPRLDVDGNPAAGIIIPAIAAPVATLSGKAVRGKGFGEGEICAQNGSSIPFPKTKAERIATGDGRLSLEERYPGGQAEYAEKYTQAVAQLVADRYLLPDDADVLMAAVPRLP